MEMHVKSYVYYTNEYGSLSSLVFSGSMQPVLSRDPSLLDVTIPCLGAVIFDRAEAQVPTSEGSGLIYTQPFNVDFYLRDSDDHYFICRHEPVLRSVWLMTDAYAKTLASQHIP